MHVSASLLVVSVAAAMLGVCDAELPGHYPGSFRDIMMMVKSENGRLSYIKGLTKMARLAPESPGRMWAKMDPPGSPGMLNEDDILSNRIARSLKSIDEIEEIEESSVDSRVVRSVSNRREARQDDGDNVTDAPEEESSTDAPEEVTEEPEEVEEETEPPVTTPAPVICGGDLTPTLDPNTVQNDAEGRFFSQHILSPGYEDGEYPDQGFECEWTIGIGDECNMGMIMFVVNEGTIRETARCTEDHLAVSYRGQPENKFCGQLKQGQHQVSGTDIWTEPTPLAMKITFRAGERGFNPGIRSVGEPTGFNMTISSYCWAWNPAFLAGSTKAPTTTSTTSTTTEAPSDEPVTTISEDGQGYDDEATPPPQDGFEESGERFSDIPNDLESVDSLSNPLVPELSSASSVESLGIASLISPEESANSIDVDSPDTDMLNTEALNPIISESELLPVVPEQADTVPIVPSSLVPSQDDAASSAASSLGNADPSISEPEESTPLDNKPVPVDSNPQVLKPTPTNSEKQNTKKPNKTSNKNRKTTKSPGSYIPIAPLRGDSNIMDGDTPKIAEKINLEPIISQLLEDQ